MGAFYPRLAIDVKHKGQNYLTAKGEAAPFRQTLLDRVLSCFVSGPLSGEDASG